MSLTTWANELQNGKCTVVRSLLNRATGNTGNDKACLSTSKWEHYSSTSCSVCTPSNVEGQTRFFTKRCENTTKTRWNNAVSWIMCLVRRNEILGDTEDSDSACCRSLLF